MHPRKEENCIVVYFRAPFHFRNSMIHERIELQPSKTNVQMPCNVRDAVSFSIWHRLMTFQTGSKVPNHRFLWGAKSKSYWTKIRARGFVEIIWPFPKLFKKQQNHWRFMRNFSQHLVAFLFYATSIRKERTLNTMHYTSDIDPQRTEFGSAWSSTCARCHLSINTYQIRARDISSRYKCLKIIHSGIVKHAFFSASRIT